MARGISVMTDERWNSPFPHTIAYYLFKKHFTELNQVYWSFVPAYNTILSEAKKNLNDDNADPKEYFLIRDEDDRRLPQTFSEWKISFKEFSNYTRLNMVMLLSSCFETYMRTVIANAFESKPGVIIMCPDSIDGVFLLKKGLHYGNSADKNYQFSEQINDICQGEWTKRFSMFEKYFGALPNDVLDKTGELDKLRVLRNNIGHFFGRTKDDYTAPAYIKPISAIRVSHDKLLCYFKLINDVVNQIDLYLKINYIGAYDIIKIYYRELSLGNISGNTPELKAGELKKIIGSQGLTVGGKDYYSNLISYCDAGSQNDVCIYGRKACIREINNRLLEEGIALSYNGQNIKFNKDLLSYFIKSHDLKNDAQYCQKNPANTKQNEYRYSQKLINFIVKTLRDSSEEFLANAFCN